MGNFKDLAFNIRPWLLAKARWEIKQEMRQWDAAHRFTSWRLQDVLGRECISRRDHYLRQLKD